MTSYTSTIHCSYINSIKKLTWSAFSFFLLLSLNTFFLLSFPPSFFLPLKSTTANLMACLERLLETLYLSWISAKALPKGQSSSKFKVNPPAPTQLPINYPYTNTPRQNGREEEARPSRRGGATPASMVLLLYVFPANAVFVQRLYLPSDSGAQD